MSVTVMPNPWNQLPSALEPILDVMDKIATRRAMKDDMGLVAGTHGDPNALAEIVPKLQIPQMQLWAGQALMKNMMEGQPHPVYDAQGNPMGKTMPGDAIQTKTLTNADFMTVINPDTKKSLRLQVGQPTPDGYMTEDAFKAIATTEETRSRDRNTAAHQQTEESLARDRNEILRQNANTKESKDTLVDLAVKASQGDQEAAKALATYQKYQGGLAETKAKATQSGKAIDPAAIKYYAGQAMAGNPVAMGNSAALRSAVGAEIQRTMDEQGETASGIATRQNVRKSLGASLAVQEKSIGSMTGFVSNLDKQVDRVGEIGKDLVFRVGLRALDVPLRELKTKFAGNPNEKILEAYTTEISNEISKLSTGSQASVAEPSLASREKWAKIHDPNLTMKELQQILEETKHMGHMRLDSSTEDRDWIKGQLDQIGEAKSQAKPQQTQSTPVGTTKEIMHEGKKITVKKMGDNQWEQVQ